MTNWSDTPPTVAGTYWVKYGRGGREVVAVFDAEEWLEVGEFGSSCRPDEATELVQFGHRIPTNAELGELPGLIDRLKTLLLSASLPVCLDANREELIAIKAKVNAILGGAE